MVGDVTLEPRDFAPRVCARLRGLEACDDVPSDFQLTSDLPATALRYLSEVRLP